MVEVLQRLLTPEAEGLIRKSSLSGHRHCFLMYLDLLLHYFRLLLGTFEEWMNVLSSHHHLDVERLGEVPKKTMIDEVEVEVE